MLTEQKQLGIRDKMPFVNFEGVLVVKYIKILKYRCSTNKYTKNINIPNSRA